MIHIVLDKHSESCLATNEKLRGTELEGWSRYCQLNPQNFVFFAGSDFYLLTYFGCIEGYSHLDFKREVLKEIFGRYSDLEWYKVGNERYNDDRFKDFALYGTGLHESIRQVNYIYRDAVGMRYCITTEMPFIEAFFNLEKVEANAQKAIDYLKANRLDYLCSEVEQLLQYNIIGLRKSDAVIIKTINQITKIINTHGNHEECQHQGTAEARV
jgi:hypothetical protein